MKIAYEKDIQGDIYTGEHARTIKHLCAPWNLGAENLWLGLVKYNPQSSSNKHSHDGHEEVFYCISGTGYIIVDQEKRKLEPGTVVYVPSKAMHQITNHTDDTLTVLAAVSPPFEMNQYKKDHQFSR